MCEHLIELENELKLIDIKENSRGEAWSANCREWVYYDCYFNEESIRTRFKLPPTVKYYEYDGRTAGQECGFIDELTNDAVLGNTTALGIKGNKKQIS